MKRFISKFSILALILALGLSSCLKERPGNMNPSSGLIKNIVEFRNTGNNMAGASSFYPLYSTDLGSLTQGQKKAFNINVGYSGMDVAPTDIVVNLAIDAAALTRYNTENGTSYIAPPAGIVAFPASITIPKGSRYAVGEATVTLTSSYDFSKSYALPLKIVSTSPTETISGNFGSALYNFSVRNAYDGIYSIVDGFVQRYTSPTTPESPSTLSGSMAGNPDVKLSTVDANTLLITGLTWHGGTSGIAGIDNLMATIDPATNLVTMKALGNTTLANIPGKVNKYDPATKTLTLNFDWNQTANKREVYVVLKYSQPR